MPYKLSFAFAFMIMKWVKVRQSFVRCKTVGNYLEVKMFVILLELSFPSTTGKLKNIPDHGGNDRTWVMNIRYSASS